MMASDFIVDVTEGDFEYQVLAYSQEVPVVVDFWAPWCAPCRVLGPILEKMAIEAEGAFRLARVNVDENQALARRYNVRSIPAVKAFRDGKMVSEFAGALPAPKVAEFIRQVVPSENELNLEKGFSLLKLNQIRGAETVFREVLDTEPDNPQALLGLAKCLLILGEAHEAHWILKNFPPSREYNAAENLRFLASILVQAQPDDVDADSPLEAAYENALRLARRGNLEAALDGLLDILRQDRRFRFGEPRRIILGILDLWDAEDPQARQYRSELASVLF